MATVEGRALRSTKVPIRRRPLLSSKAFGRGFWFLCVKMQEKYIRILQERIYFSRVMVSSSISRKKMGKMKLEKRKTRKIQKSENQKIQGNIHGKRYKKKNGWIRMQIWGNAFERGYAHGHLLSSELANIREVTLPFLVKTFQHISYEKYERTCHDELYENIRTEYPEFFEEMSGIAAGCNLSFDFILAWNAHLSMSNFFKRIHKKKHHGGTANDGEDGRCSAFIAIGDATETGEIVMAHNTHSDFVSANTFNVVLEIDPYSVNNEKKKGKKIKMQTAPGFIASGSDFFLCGSGIIGCETTIGGINYKPDFSCKKTPYFCRVRQAMQYADSLDEFTEIMKKGNAGDYACSWLLGHTRPNKDKPQEIMLFELGLNTVNIERKTNGLFYGMNAAISPEIREKETSDHLFWDRLSPCGARNIRFHFLLYEKYYGKIGVSNARDILADHYDVSTNEETKGNGLTICRHANLETRIAASPRGAFYPWGCTDGKVVSSAMAKRGSFLGRWGPTCGHAFSASAFLKQHPKYKKWSPVLPNMPTEPWITL